MQQPADDSTSSRGNEDRANGRAGGAVPAWAIPCAAPVASGLALWLCFPPVGWSLLAWFALVPLATMALLNQRAREIYWPAWLGGLAFALLAVQWICFADDVGMSGYFGWVGLATYISLYFPAFVFVVRTAVRRFRVPGILAVPVAWVGLEFFRGWFLGGFGWYFIGHSQSRAIGLIQIADVAGATGVSFVVAMINGWLLDLLALPRVRRGAGGRRLAPQQAWRLGLIAAVLTATFGYGAVRLDEARDEPGPRVALVQTNIPQSVKESSSLDELMLVQYGQLIERAIDVKPAIAIWPETADRNWWTRLDPDVTDDDLRRLFADDPNATPERVRRRAAESLIQWHEFADLTRVAILMGMNSEHVERTTRRLFNTAALVMPHAESPRPYDKMHLVPFGEYLPLRDVMPWLRVFTPHDSANYGLEAGSEAVRIRLGDLTLGTLICFEDTVPWVAREYVRREPVDVLVNISNDGWFGTATDAAARLGFFQRAQHEAHLAISVFRAVECRRPLVRAVNTGVSAIIDSSGRVRASSADFNGHLGSSGVVIGEVPLDHRTSLYAQTGDWLGAGSCIFVAVALAAAFAQSLWLRRTAPSKSGGAPPDASRPAP